MFIDPKTVLLRWEEPGFFPFRVRSWRGWLGRVVIFAAFYLIFAGLFANNRADRPDPNFASPLVRTLVLPAIVAGFFLGLIELPNVRRTITISKSGIDCGGSVFSIHLSLVARALLTRQWNPREIKEVQLLRAGEPANRFPWLVMLVTPKYSRPATIGVSRKMPLLQVAKAWESLGVAVKCSDLADVPPKNPAQIDSRFGP